MKNKICLVIIMLIILTFVLGCIEKGIPGYITGRCIEGYDKNTFYPGIDWKKDDLPNLEYDAKQLDSQLRYSYEGTDQLSGAFYVYLAYKNIPTKENYLALNDGDGDYKIAFAHSGGTQTLIKKIEEGRVTADYVVLAAPALIDTSKLKKFLEEKRIRKKVIIYQSTNDILYRLKVSVEEEHVENRWIGSNFNYWSGSPIYLGIQPNKLGDKFPAITVLSDIKLSDMGLNTVGLPINTSGWVIDVTSLYKKNGISIPSNIQPKKEEFWIGGADRSNQKLFENKEDIITVNPDYPSDMSSNDVHQELLHKMANDFEQHNYPFNGAFDDLEKKGCLANPVGNSDMLKLSNKLTNFLKGIGVLGGN